MSFDRSLRKDAFYFYKANWNRDEIFLHIATSGGRAVRRTPHDPGLLQRPGGEALCGTAILYDRRENDGLGRFLWRGIELHEERM